MTVLIFYSCICSVLCIHGMPGDSSTYTSHRAACYVSTACLVLLCSTYTGQMAIFQASFINELACFTFFILALLNSPFWFENIVAVLRTWLTMRWPIPYVNNEVTGWPGGFGWLCLGAMALAQLGNFIKKAPVKDCDKINKNCSLLLLTVWVCHKSFTKDSAMLVRSHSTVCLRTSWTILFFFDN